MKVLFPKGVPEGCTQWLRENVGIGNVEVDGNRTQQWITDIPEYAWFYKREAMGISPLNPDAISYVPTITVKDPKKAAWFVMRWAS
jgi:hypothetical protein